MSALSQVQVRRFTAGQAIFQEGDEAHNEAFLIQSGKVAIRKIVGGEERTLRVLGEGELLGEVSFFRAGPAAAPGPGCPFAGMIAAEAAQGPGGMAWSGEAEARVERIPSFIRPMARKAIERYAEGKGYRTITEAVMDEGRGALGM